MRKQWKGFLSGVLTMALLLVLVEGAYATVGSKTAQLDYSNINVTLDGKQVSLVDANGNAVEPFAISGTTYLPIRAISNALGLNVEWDGSTNTVKLTNPGAGNQVKPGENNGTESYNITYQNCRVYESAYGSSTRYSSIVEVENKGTANLYLKDATFDFEDKSGHLLETKSFVSMDPDIIAPGEKGYFYSSGTLEKVKPDTEYVFKPTLKIEKAKNNIIRYEVTDLSKNEESYGSLNITGRVKNNTDKDDNLVWVFVVLYRKDGTPIVAGGTNILELKAGETASFSRSFSESELGVSSSDVASYKVFACKTQYQF